MEKTMAYTYYVRNAGKERFRLCSDDYPGFLCQARAGSESGGFQQGMENAWSMQNPQQMEEMRKAVPALNRILWYAPMKKRISW